MPNTPTSSPETNDLLNGIDRIRKGTVDGVNLMLSGIGLGLETTATVARGSAVIGWRVGKALLGYKN